MDIDPRPVAVPRLNAPSLARCAENDTRGNATGPAFAAAPKSNGSAYAMPSDAGTQHGFHDDSTPRHHEACAQLAWKRTLPRCRRHRG